MNLKELGFHKTAAFGVKHFRKGLTNIYANIRKAGGGRTLAQDSKFKNQLTKMQGAEHKLSRAGASPSSLHQGIDKTMPVPNLLAQHGYGKGSHLRKIQEMR